MKLCGGYLMPVRLWLNFYGLKTGRKKSPWKNIIQKEKLDIFTTKKIDSVSQVFEFVFLIYWFQVSEKKMHNRQAV